MQWVEVPDPKPGAAEVLVRVRACGLNHLDLWTERGELPVPIQLPRIQGCEIAGEILEAGPAVSGWEAGDRVAIQSNIFCGKCEYCARGEESQCLNPIMLGVQVDGGFAEKVVVSERAVGRLPVNVDFQTSAALTLGCDSDAVRLRTSSSICFTASFPYNSAPALIVTATPSLPPGP